MLVMAKIITINLAEHYDTVIRNAKNSGKSVSEYIRETMSAVNPIEKKVVQGVIVKLDPDS